MTDSPPPGRQFARLLWLAALLLFAGAMVRTAWLGDDCYITFRTIENWLQGHGPRWNVADRVQTYTHPLWMLLMTAARALSGEFYFTALVLGGVLSLAALAVITLGCGAGAGVGAAAVLGLLASRAFLDYSTSGLENPLTHLLLAAFGAVFLRGGDPLRRLRRLGLLAGLLLCNRMDLGAAVLPALVWALRGTRPVAAARALALGLLPFLLWLGFATLYYGSPFPNTAYAKALAVDLPAADLMLQGLRYLAVAGREDPATLALLAAGAIAACTRPGRRALPLILGMLCSLLYVVRIGGDFMGGRMLTPALVLATAAAVHASARAPRPAWATALTLLGLSFVPGTHPALAAPDELIYSHHGVVDERAVYYPGLGLLSPDRRIPQPGLVSASMRRAGMQDPVFDLYPQVGVHAFVAGDLVHIVDIWLCDPLICRLPALPGAKWRVGHFPRRIPVGYLESLAHGDDRVRHPGLRRYWHAIRSATRDPLWSADRWRNLWALWSGALDGHRQAYVAGDYRQPTPVPVAAAELSAQVPDGTFWFRCDARVVGDGGVEIRLGAANAGRSLRLGLDSGECYRLQWLRHGVPVAEAELDTGLPFGGIRGHAIEVPEAAAGWDAIRITCPQPGGDRVAAVGWLRTDP